MEELHVYRTSLKWTEQRKGSLSSPNLHDIQVATPPEFTGGHPGLWSPETLYVSSAEACLMTTFLSIAEKSNLPFTTYRSEAEGTLRKTDEGYRITDIAITVNLTVPDESAKGRAQRILESAERHCLIANSMKTAIHLSPEVVVG